MTESMPENACPKCGGTLYQTDKNTFTGEVWREYTCRSCRHVVDVNEGTALWQVLHDDVEIARQHQILAAKSVNPARLGFITYLGIPVFIQICFLGGSGEHFSMYREGLVMILWLGFICLVFYYLRLVVKNPGLGLGSKIKWIASILLFHLFPPEK